MIPAKFSIERIRDAITMPTLEIASARARPRRGARASDERRRVQAEDPDQREEEHGLDQLPSSAELSVFASTIDAARDAGDSSIRIGPNSRS